MMRPLRRLDAADGETIANEFGPRALKLIRRAMIDEGLARTNINHQIGRIKRFWRWAVSEELVRQDMAHGLDAVVGLQRGREGVAEAPPVLPVSLDAVTATLPYLSPQIAAMVKVQLLCGMRPQDIHNMRPKDIDRTRPSSIQTNANST